MQRTPSTRLSLAIAETLPEVYVSIETKWDIEKVLDKRMNEDLKHYQYLVKYKGWSNVCNCWVNPADILDPSLVEQFELKRLQQVKEKQHVAAWYPFGEHFVVQWKQHPFFIVPYGGGQMNKFCVVGLNKSGLELKCKHAHHPNNPQHQVHVQIVKKEMTRLGLTIWNKTFIPIDQMPKNPTLPSPISIPSRKPYSTTKINLKGNNALNNIRLQLHQSSSSIPQEFKPNPPPKYCTCTTPSEQGTEVVHCTPYKVAPEALPKETTLWLHHGPPVTGRKAYVW